MQQNNCQNKILELDSTTKYKTYNKLKQKNYKSKLNVFNTWSPLIMAFYLFAVSLELLILGQ